MNCDVTMYGWGTLYGVDSAPEEQTALQLDLRPVLALKARVALIRDVPKGEHTGYGRAFQTKRDSRIAILPIGYADGLPRVYPMGERMCEPENLQLPLLGASVWTSLR